MSTQILTPAKPFKSYEELIDILKARGMLIPNEQRALRKLSQIGYYRLSGFWYIFREFTLDSYGNKIPSPLNSCNKRRGTNPSSPQSIIPLRSDKFIDGTNFDDIITLYIFDKKLRIAMLDALERIEIYIRSIIAHEMGKFSPVAYDDVRYIDKRHLVASKNSKISPWDKWKNNSKDHIDRSREDYIKWHKITNKQIPFWVAIETWDFGLMSKYFSYLNYDYKLNITNRIDATISPKILENWLHQLNVLRNRCAHHTRIWNQNTGDKMLATAGVPAFQQIQLSEDARKRQCGLIAIIWFLLHQINPTSQWLKRIRSLIETHVTMYPSQATAMGFSDKNLPELKKIEQFL